MFYRYALTPDDDDTVLITSPDFPEVTSFAECAEDAPLYASGAILEAVAARIAARQDLPAPHARVDEAGVPLSLQVQLKIAVYRRMREEGLTKAELARQLGWHDPQISRLFDLNHATRLPDLDRALAVLHARPVVDVLAVA